MIVSILEDFEQVMQRGSLESETAGAILVLAASIERTGTFSRSNAENFGHELALALKHVFEHSSISVNGSIQTE
jgi:hypothetical protein